MQTSLSFKSFLHYKENNNESEQHLHAHQSHFNSQCQRVYDLLKQGIRLTVKDAMVKYNINSLPRRIKDISDKGIAVKTNWIKSSGVKYKEYYL